MSYGLLWWIIDSKKQIYINNSNNFVCGIITYFKPSVFDRIDFIQKYLDK